mmetsp:Transcript_105803/g.183938  ORF Transcript_105803/g.183938 Transcript_105803/m.183938 type:complete len:350 (-) Transcript_105803:68-1117(-)
MAMMESAFLTSLKMDTKAQSKAAKREELLDGMRSGGHIMKLHGELQALADELDEKVEAKLNANENAFFLAYKSHMYTVRREFNDLRQKADEEETKTRRDAKIQSLEKELDWFMNEALRLDELCKKYKKELDKWKGKAECLEDDRQFLENLIKTAKKNNKQLRGAVEKAQTSAYSALVAADDGGQQSPSMLQDVSPSPESGPEEDPRAGPLSKELEERYQTCVKRLKQQLETEQRLAAKMRAVSDRQFGEPSELESFFLHCIDKVKAEIAERRKNTQEYNKRLAAPSRKKGKDASQSTALALQGPEVAIDDFTVVDRRKVVELLLSSEQVLQFLYNKLFPGTQGTNQAGM